MRNLAFFALLYFVQGAALAYIINFQKPYLAGQGISKETLGLFTSLLLIPFILKVFLGMLSDRVPWGKWGSRKPYMTLGLALFAACYFTLSTLAPGESFLLFAIVTWLASLGLALFDTCADGWAVDVAEDHQQSSIQAAMVGGKSLGLILMSYAFGVLAESEGFRTIFLVIATLSAFVLLAVWCVPYRPRQRAQRAELVGHWRDLMRGFYLCFAAFGVLYSIASFGTDGLVTLHLSEALKVGVRQIGDFGVARGMGALLGAGLHAYLAHRLGLKRAQVLALLALGAGILLPLSGLPILMAALFWGMAWGFQETAYVTLAMRFAQGAWSATFFAIAMIFSNLGTSIGEGLAAPLVPLIGYSGVFMAFAGLAWACLLLVPWMMRPVE
ncbi:MAG: MFS transporter [Bdellovibrionales bacterium]|nr:MFS transporter [Bdellovibrionales bacterium]